MPETLATADGEKIDFDSSEQAFAAAMAAPRADDPEAPGPPDIGAIDPEAPYGRTTAGKPKKGPGGRPAGREKPRTVSGKAVPAPQKAAGGSKDEPKGGNAADYAKGLGEFLGGLQLALAILPFPTDSVRVHCRYQSAVLEQTGDGLATGLGTVAEHNGAVRWGVEKLTQGGGAWAFPAAMAIAPFAVSTAMLWKAPVTDQMREGAATIEAEAMARLRAEMGMDEAEPAPEPAAA